MFWSQVHTFMHQLYMQLLKHIFPPFLMLWRITLWLRQMMKMHRRKRQLQNTASSANAEVSWDPYFTFKMYEVHRVHEMCRNIMDWQQCVQKCFFFLNYCPLWCKEGRLTVCGHSYNAKLSCHPGATWGNQGKHLASVIRSRVQTLSYPQGCINKVVAKMPWIQVT